MKKWTLRILFVLSALLSASALIASTTFAANNNGAGAGGIWTTDSTCGTQDVNHYNTGDIVYIRGSNFVPGDYDWNIQGQPGNA